MIIHERHIFIRLVSKCLLTFSASYCLQIQRASSICQEVLCEKVLTLSCSHNNRSKKCVSLCFLCFSLSVCVCVCLPASVSLSFWKNPLELMVELAIKPGVGSAGCTYQVQLIDAHRRMMLKGAGCQTLSAWLLNCFGKNLKISVWSPVFPSRIFMTSLLTPHWAPSNVFFLITTSSGSVLQLLQTLVINQSLTPFKRSPCPACPLSVLTSRSQIPHSPNILD